MKNSKKTITRVLLIAVATTAMFIFVHAQDAKDWVIPAKYKTMKNPSTDNKENQSQGKDLYMKHCKSCHGTTGLGDGPKAAALDASCGDFSSAKFQAKTDGEIFFMETEGKGKMPSFKKTIPDDNDRWMIIHFLRQLKSK
jgi:mono/diheme cytochrome c family protein